MAIKHNAIVSRKDLMMVNPELIRIADSWNPRTEFDTEKLDELKNSIIENGVQVPIRVKVQNDNTMLLIDGERRLRAVLKAIKEGIPIVSIPAIIERKTMKPSDMLLLAMTTNTGVPLTPLEESYAMERLLNYGMSINEVATKLGKSVQHVKNRLLLKDATPEVKQMVQNKEINLKDATEIIKDSSGDTEKQNEKAKVKKAKKQLKIKKASRKIIFELFEDIVSDLEEFKEYPQLYQYVNKIKLLIEQENI